MSCCLIAEQDTGPEEDVKAAKHRDSGYGLDRHFRPVYNTAADAGQWKIIVKKEMASTHLFNQIHRNEAFTYAPL
jgi:hypothetical protein